MLLQNAEPLLIFRFKKMEIPFTGGLDLAGWINSKLPDWFQIGLPIPFVLNKKAGWVDDGDTNIFTIRTEIVGEKVVQRGLNQEVQAHYRLESKSTAVQVLIPLLEKCFQYINSDKYSYDVTYLNGETLIFNGRISDFSTAPNADNNSLMDINFSITTEPLATGNGKSSKTTTKDTGTLNLNPGSKFTTNGGSL